MTKNVALTLKANQKITSFYHNKDKDLLNVGCDLLQLTNIYLQKSTDAKFDPFLEGDKNFLGKIERMLLVVRLSYSQGKPILMELLLEIKHTYGNLLIRLRLPH